MKKNFIAMTNFSNGKDPAIYEAIIDTARNVEGVKLVSYEPEAGFNRTVVNMVGEAEALKGMLINMVRKTMELIDMEKQVGSHPRIGAMDSVSIYPTKDSSVEDVHAYIKELGKTLYEELGVPIYFSGASASSEARKDHTLLRKGGYEGLRDLLLEIKDDPSRAEEYAIRKPEYSVDGLLHKTAGGTMLFAVEEVPSHHNVFLSTEDVSIAKKIARTIRASSGGLVQITAIGIKFEERKEAVVSFNVMDTRKTCITVPFEMIKREAAKYGVSVIGSEVVGIVRLAPLIEVAMDTLRLENFDLSHIIDMHLM